MKATDWHADRLSATARRAARLLAARRQAEQRPDPAGLLASQRQFLQDAAHELRTPITIALGHAELLASVLTEQQNRRDIRVIVGEL